MFQKSINFLSEFSIPLILGVFLALSLANLWDIELYQYFLHYPLLGPNLTLLGHPVSFHFLMNDIFMVFFFGIAAVEITQAILPNGSLNPISKAINPLFATIGGIVGPVLIYFLLCYLFQVDASIYKGWGIPTATDIALAWLLARFIFGNKHPAVSFLLLLAVADDAIGLGIIAVFYPDPNHPVEAQWLFLTALGMLIAFLLNRFHAKNFWLYLIFGGIPSWLGLILAHLHPALALVFIVPFMPAGHGIHKELFEDEPEKTTLANFEHFFKLFVDFGLFGFGLANAAVSFGNIESITWLIFFSLFIGKTLGILGFSYLAHLLGISLPKRIGFSELFTLGMIAGLGLTVALFIAGEAFTDSQTQSAAKMGALFSAFIVIPVYIFAKILKVKRIVN